MTTWEESLRTGRLQEILETFEWNSLLDIGCGKGDLLAQIDRRYSGRHLVGVDLNASRVEQARAKGVEGFQLNAENLDKFSDSVFDVVVSTNVIEHVENQDAMLGEIFRVLRPGGMLFLTTVFKKMWSWHFYRAPCGWALDPTHLREYSRDEDLLDSVSSAGFDILDQGKKLTMRRPIRRINFWVPTFGYYSWEIVAKKNGVG
jgi:ubiquinone/menaquinone biosynthesis C-methylase UbiE